MLLIDLVNSDIIFLSQATLLRFFLKLGFNSTRVEPPIQNMELHEKEKDINETHTEKLIRKTPTQQVAKDSRVKVLSVDVPRNKLLKINILLTYR